MGGQSGSVLTHSVTRLRPVPPPMSNSPEAAFESDEESEELDEDESEG